MSAFYLSMILKSWVDLSNFLNFFLRTLDLCRKEKAMNYNLKINLTFFTIYAETNI